MIDECFTARTITPGVTTIDDLVWHYWQTSRDIGLEVAFRPYFRIHRDPRAAAGRGGPPRRRRSTATPASSTCASTPTTSTSPTSPAAARPTRPPASRRAWPTTYACRTSSWPASATASPATRCCATCWPRPPARASRAAKIYSHNLGLFLHQPGPLIGLPWEQEDTGPRGEVTLEYASAFVMELGTEGPVPEWGGAPLRLGTEEPVLFDRDGCRTVCPRQTEFHLI